MPDDFARRLAERVGARGSLSVAAYMAVANAHYYATRDPFGSAGDFVTAPEVSQMFGEMVGAALADVWARSGAGAAAYVELGPGRGTLARDALVVLARAGLSPPVHFVETSPVLRQAQTKLLPQAHFHATVASLPDLPLLLVANEFFDALPVRQLIRTGEGRGQDGQRSGWRELAVDLDDDGRWVPHPAGGDRGALVPPELRQAAPGSIVESAPAGRWIMRQLARRLARHGGAMLIIDYGRDRPACGATLQAVRGHAPGSPFTAPGEQDLSAHVDFAALGRVARRQGARVAGPVGQGRWLMALGIGQRAAKLASAHPQRAPELAAALTRLTAPDQMGELFRVMAVAAAGWPDVAGLAPAPTPA